MFLERFNLAGFRIINDLAGQNVWLDRFMIFSADMMGYFMIVSVLALFYKKDYFKKLIFVSFGSALVARIFFVEIIRYFLYSPRPFLVLDNVNQLMNHAFESSFPSGHTTFYFALAYGVYLLNKNPAPSNSVDHQQKGRTWCGARVGRVYLILAGLVGFARVFVGVHWPLDIVFGAILGVVTAYIMERYVFPRLAILA